MSERDPRQLCHPQPKYDGGDLAVFAQAVAGGTPPSDWNDLVNGRDGWEGPPPTCIEGSFTDVTAKVTAPVRTPRPLPPTPDQATANLKLALAGLITAVLICGGSGGIVLAGYQVAQEQAKATAVAAPGATPTATTTPSATETPIDPAKEICKTKTCFGR